jgi:GT2 family glycosyltransferase
MKVGIVILSWNSSERIMDCLNSIDKYLDQSIYIVDNGSIDNSVEIITKHSPSTTLIELPVNHGFCGGCNVGMKKALKDGCDAVLLLNDDTIVVEDFITPLAELMKSHTKIGIIGPIIVEAYNEDLIQFGGGTINKWSASFRYKRRGERYQRSDTLIETDYMLGAGMMISKEVIDKIGFLDEDYYPAYVEEADFCYRAKEAGFGSYIYDGVRLKHVGGASQGSYGVGFIRLYKNKFLFTLKHNNALQFLTSSLIICSRIVIYKVLGRL